MIFLTVGHQMPFDRLVQAVDEWAALTGRDDVFAQIGSGDYQPRACRAVQYLAPGEFRRQVENASVIVGHAGTGTIIAALEAAKPLLVLPRRAALGETRSDHQLATARHFSDRGLILVAWTEDELSHALPRLLHFTPFGATDQSGTTAELHQRLRDFAFGDDIDTRLAG